MGKMGKRNGKWENFDGQGETYRMPCIRVHVSLETEKTFFEFNFKIALCVVKTIIMILFFLFL